MMMMETVYAVHNFEAENDDELTFSIGEAVIVIQKDDGFNDGWWKGKNIRGEVGLFPMNYILPQQQPCQQQQQQLLPTPSNSDTTKKSSQHHPSHIDTSTVNTTNSNSTTPTTPISADSPSARSSYSYTCLITTGRSSTSMSNHSNSSTQSHNNTALRRSVINALFLPHLQSTSPEEWDMDQVEVWLDAMNFGSIAANFKSQEITGDILLELNMEALKELDVPTFGKRFKVHTAIQVLREECGYQSIRNRMSIASSLNCSTSDEPRFRHSLLQSSPTNTSPTSRYSNPIYNRQSYHSNLISATTANKHYCRSRSRSQRRSNNSNSMLYQHEDDDEEDDKEEGDLVSIKSNIPNTMIDSPGHKNYDKMDHRAAAPSQKMPNLTTRNSNKVDDALTQAQQKRQTTTAILSMAHRSSMDIYSTRTTDEHGNATPDMEGWLFKQGCKYKKWNKRWFVLKGPNLFYFKSPKDVRMKGIINLRGYRIIPDETIQPGKYSFKAQHEEERTFYFYTDLDTHMKSWISSLMKATISRDFTAPVLSSSVIPTVSLDVARRMRPRPPSVLLYRKENLNRLTLSPQSYEATYGGFLHSPPISSCSEKGSSHSSNQGQEEESQEEEEEEEEGEEEELTNQDSEFDSDHQPINRTSSRDTANPEDEDDDEEESEVDENETRPFIFQDVDEGHFELDKEEEIQNIQDKSKRWTAADYIQWVNTICSHSAKITTLSELRQGEILIELLEQLSGKKVKVLPPSTIGSISMLMLDNIVAVIKFMSMEGIEMEDKFTIKDIFGGKEDKTKVMLQSILEWSMQYEQ